jgi:DNA-binding IclR family transcriptional regulator
MKRDINSLPSRVDDAVLRLKSAFEEIPGTRLTPDEAARLVNLDAETCRAVLTALEDARFLRRSGSDAFVSAKGCPEA